MRTFTLRRLVLLLFFAIFLQISCNDKKSVSAESLVGKWQIREIIVSSNGGALTTTLKPPTGEISLGSDGQFKGHYYVLHGPNNMEELSGKAQVNPAAKTVQVTEGSYGSKPILFKYILKKEVAYLFLILEGDGQFYQEAVHIKVVLARKK